MIIWLTGNTGAGKTTLAMKLKRKRTIILDGDDIREINGDFDLSNNGREAHNIRIAKMARMLEEQGFDVVVSVICPTQKLRDKVREITGCIFIYLPYKNDDTNEKAPYERAVSAEITLPERELISDSDKCRTQYELY